MFTTIFKCLNQTVFMADMELQIQKENQSKAAE